MKCMLGIKGGYTYLLAVYTSEQSQKNPQTNPSLKHFRLCSNVIKVKNFSNWKKYPTGKARCVCLGYTSMFACVLMKRTPSLFTHLLPTTVSQQLANNCR